MSKLSSWRTICFLCAFCAAISIASAVGTFRTLVSFDGPDGEVPSGPLVQGLDGNFYGTTEGGGGTNGYGTFFKVTPGGKLTTLHIFNFTEGEPYAGLVQAADGNFYGTTYGGGVNHIGSVFKVTAGGKLTTLHSFDGTDGANPEAVLVQATDGNFYGTTSDGGASGFGTVFKITSAGTLTTLHNFEGTDGQYPSAGLVQATNGNFYGTTTNGGTGTACMGGSCGTVFEITPTGKLTTLHSFDGTDGASPYAWLVQAANGNFYGTTSNGGVSDACSNGCGTVFEITAGGKLTTLHSFDGSDGSDPGAGLVQATDGNFYGATYQGGASPNCSFGCGTLFEITPAGKLTTLHSFDSTDGAIPNGLLQGTNGNFYGTTAGGASRACGAFFGCGTVFSLAVGLGPFVETMPTSGKAGATVTILGTNLAGSTSVTFNGKAAAFKVVSSTEIKTTVPSGATTGKVSVKTPHGTLTSNVNFRVTP
jgi:uncharacterized repeat protein (TIGR03803 family)